MKSGEIYRHDRFYADPETGEMKSKYLLFLAPMRGGDWVARLLTSRQNGRPRNPPCYHGDPYPGYFVGIPGAPLVKETWVDLHAFDDIDEAHAAGLIAKGVLHHVGTLTQDALREVMDCVARAPDTTRAQEQAIRDRMVS